MLPWSEAFRMPGALLSHCVSGAWNCILDPVKKVTGYNLSWRLCLPRKLEPKHKVYMLLQSIISCETLSVHIAVLITGPKPCPYNTKMSHKAANEVLSSSPSRFCHFTHCASCKSQPEALRQRTWNWTFTVGTCFVYLKAIKILK
jgi:hypothetical protein